jgi:ATP-dependent DNA helicase DinG
MANTGPIDRQELGYATEGNHSLHQESELTMGIDPVAVLGPDGVIARGLPGYEVRQEQLQMAEAVARAIESGSHLMVEAGTGVGKSFGYLVPAILAATEMGKKVIVSTRTINLQEQLIHKDLPFLRTVLP